MSNEDKYSLPKAVISELKDPVKLKGVWSIIKMFPAILFLVALYLIADRYIESKEKTEFEKIKKEFLYRSIDDLASPEALKRRTATLLVGMILGDSEDPNDFLKMMYVTETDSANRQAYLHEAVNQLLPQLYDKEEETRNEAFQKLKAFWIHETVIIHELLNYAYKNKEKKTGEEGIELSVKIIDEYPPKELKKFETQLIVFFEEVRNITTETYQRKTDILNKLSK